MKVSALIPNFRYPGCACDIPAHSYQLSFESNTDWTSFYATAPEILRYWQKVADKYGIRKYLRLGNKAVEARWDEKAAKWTVKFEVVKTGEMFEDTADVVMTGCGALNEFKWPNIEGIHDFKGNLLHSALWDESFDYKVGFVERSKYEKRADRHSRGRPSR